MGFVQWKILSFHVRIIFCFALYLYFFLFSSFMLVLFKYNLDLGENASENIMCMFRFRINVILSVELDSAPHGAESNAHKQTQ